MHGISHTDVFRSVWSVVDAVNASSVLAFKYPSDWEEQQKIADGFKKNTIGIFDCCAGAIDGILIWTERPSDKHCEIAEVGSKKFFCGRKKKFGLNMQATCDHEKRFLDIYVKHPASTSDYLAFCSSPLYCNLEKEGFMKPGLCIFGDNAYVNATYMATPYKAVKDGPKDAYNYFHSNVRINIECAFGMLVHRWGILCRPMSAMLPLSKVTSMVRCLCRLHNFCIDEMLLRRCSGGEPNSPSEETDACVPSHLESDILDIDISNGASTTSCRATVDDLLHGGEHFDDIGRNVRVSRRKITGPLPREVMCALVEEQGLKRPTPNAWKTVALANTV